ncbi:MAG: MBOAT family protein, partial [Eubacterium sp.]|nr:MBOAT family protein [Eubacterium sp.]
SNGLWHGAAWMYIFYGMYHFSLIVLANVFEPAFKKGAEVLHVDRNHGPYVAFRIVKTTVLVVIGELFFRAHGLAEGLKMFKKLFTDFSFEGITSGQVAKAGLDMCDLLIVLVVVLIVFVIGILREKGINIRENLSKKNIAVRWIILLALIFFIIIFGAYGAGYTPVEPMYADF